MAGEFLLIYIYNFHVLGHLLLIYICKLHWNRSLPALVCSHKKKISSAPSGPTTPVKKHRSSMSFDDNFSVKQDVFFHSHHLFFLLIYKCIFHVLSNLLLIYICKLHQDLSRTSINSGKGFSVKEYEISMS